MITRLASLPPVGPDMRVKLYGREGLYQTVIVPASTVEEWIAYARRLGLGIDLEVLSDR